MVSNPDPLFADKVAIVTGAGKGLGKAYALWLARHGCAVVVNNRVHAGVPSSAEALVDEIVAAGGKAVAHEGSIDDAREAQAMVDLAIAEFGRLDALICNAGVMPTAPFGELAADELARLVSINVLGTLFPAQAAWRHMLKTGYGRIVLTGSTVGTYGHGGVAAYGATRAAPIGLARSLTAERPEGADIAINVVLPFAYTPMSAESVGTAMDAEAIARISPDKIAPLVGWLCSEACRTSGRIYHSSTGRVARIGLVESRPVSIDPENVAALSDAPFELDAQLEPIGSHGSVGRLLAPA